jgi:Xaa-Pro aminopeptidase
MDYKARKTSLQSVLKANRADALLVTHLPNIRYLCGFTGSAGGLLISEDKCVLFSDGRYKEQARVEVTGSRVIISRKSPLVAAGEWLKANAESRAVKILGLEGQHLTIAARRQLHNCLGSHVRLREAPAVVEQARMIKDADEISRLRAAVQLGSNLFGVALKAIRPGAKETEVAAEVEYAARRAGAEGMSFETIIASGPRSALPHGRASASEIPDNGFTVCDFGIILAGYCSDMTRTVHVGKPSADAENMYQAVLQAQQAAIAAVRSGVTAGEVDAAPREVLQKARLGRYFTHSTGHGVGLEIHEAPRVAAGQTDVLRPGMVITVEPGVYIPGVGGVRIEDMVVVTESGCEVLTPTSKELIII